MLPFLAAKMLHVFVVVHLEQLRVKIHYSIRKRGYISKCYSPSTCDVGMQLATCGVDAKDESTVTVDAAKNCCNAFLRVVSLSFMKLNVE